MLKKYFHFILRKLRENQIHFFKLFLLASYSSSEQQNKKQKKEVEKRRLLRELQEK